MFRQLCGVGVGGSGEQLDERGNLFSPDARRAGQFGERSVQQIAQRPTQKRERQPAIGGQGPVGQRFVAMLGVSLGQEHLPQALVAGDDLKILHGCDSALSHKRAPSVLF